MITEVPIKKTAFSCVLGYLNVALQSRLVTANT